MSQKFAGNKVIVTGGGGGIGSTVVSGFLREGAQVLALDIDEKKLFKQKAEFLKISPKAKTMVVDVSDIKQVRKVGRYIENNFDGKVDVLVNTAAIIGAIGRFEELDLNLWQKTIEVNLLGTVNMCVLVIPFMKTSKSGKIINFSGGGDGPFPRFTAYASSKGAILRLTESLAAELKEFNIFVNAVAPGAVNTGIIKEVLKSGAGKVGKEYYLESKKQQARGGVSPSRVTNLILFLASEESGNLTGKMISAVHDNWKNIPKHLNTLAKTDIYNTRRIKPIDRGYDW
jgi:NAD(P)-dependent dehydrogenase (short-subunit alcohol dehydrogenase family)